MHSSDKKSKGCKKHTLLYAEGESEKQMGSTPKQPTAIPQGRQKYKNKHTSHPVFPITAPLELLPGVKCKKTHPSKSRKILRRLPQKNPAAGTLRLRNNPRKSITPFAEKPRRLDPSAEDNPRNIASASQKISCRAGTPLGCG